VTGTRVQLRKGSPMVSAVSADVSQAADADTSTKPAGYHWFKMPDLNRATHRRLGHSGAGWTFETICRLVHHVGRVGRPKAKKAARELGRLGVGLQAIADEAGVSVAKVRRDLVKLVDLGLIAVTRRNVTFSADPATGRIMENRTGRSLPVVVFVTVGPEHCRTKASQDRPAASLPRTAPATPATVIGPPLHDRDHFGGAIQRERNTERKPAGDAVGIGTPPAKAPGLTAGEAGGHSAAKASQERGIVRVDAADDDLPPPIGRISRPAGKAPSPRPGGKRQFPEDQREPQAFTGRDADAFAATMRRLEAERQAREAQDAAWRAASAAGKAVA